MVKRRRLDSGSVAAYRGKVGEVIKARITDPAVAEEKLSATVENWQSGYKPFNTLWGQIRGYLQGEGVPKGEWGVIRSFAMKLYKELNKNPPQVWDEIKDATVSLFSVKVSDPAVLEDIAELINPL